MNFKSAILLLLLLSFPFYQVAAQAMRKLLERPMDIVESKWEENPQEDVELNYYNSDYCDYYMWVGGARTYNLRPGKTTIYTVRKGSYADNPLKHGSRYNYYRGRFPENFKIGTLYAFPVKNGKQLGWQIDPLESFKTLNFHLLQGDTVCATRSGMACTTVDRRQLLIYHPDHTFAAYLSMEENFIVPGEEVRVGQPIGVASRRGVSISYFFLDANKFEGDHPSGYPYSHFMPVFRTEEGDVKLKEKLTYHAKIDDELIMQDMNKREQKKYLKKKNK